MIDPISRWQRMQANRLSGIQTGKAAQRTPDEAGAENRGLADPLGDLLLSVAAILVLATIVLLPLGLRPGEGQSSNRQETEIDASPGLQSLTGGRHIVPIIAGETGLRLGPAADTHIPLTHILDNQALGQRLSEIDRAGASVFLLIEPGGLESAFAFEVAARGLVRGDLFQIRLEKNCSKTEPLLLKGLCRFETRGFSAGSEAG